MSITRYNNLKPVKKIKTYCITAACSFTIGYIVKTYFFSPRDKVVHNATTSEVILDGTTYPLYGDQMGSLHHRLKGIIALPPDQVKETLEVILSSQ